MPLRANLGAAVALCAAGALANTAPIAPHFTTTISAGEQAVLALPGYDVDGDELTVTIEALPATGTLYQLSQTFSDFGYTQAIEGTPVAAGDVVTGSKNRVVYTRPDNDVTPSTGEFAQFSYSVSDGAAASEAGLVRLVPASGALVASDFYSDAADWTVVGNRAASEAPVHEASSRGLMNHFIYATDNDIHVDKASGADQTRWYFEAPDAFLGQQGLAYGGSLDFLLSSFAGDFSAANLNDDLQFVVLECATCNLNAGSRLVWFADEDTFAGTTTSFSLPLTEADGWLVDPENTQHEWVAPTKCEMIEALSGLSNVQILGDHTQWYESVSVDAVELKHGDGLPICAQHSADASVCVC